MQIYGVDAQLAEILKIKNLEMIHVWDLVNNSASKIQIIPALLISYDGGKFLNLCAKDKYFDVLVQRITQLYQEYLKNNSGNEKGIMIDDKSDQILKSGRLEHVFEKDSFFESGAVYEERLSFQIDEVKSLMPLIKYHLEKFFGVTNRVVTISENITGYRDLYAMEGTVNNLYQRMFFYFTEVSNNHYELDIYKALENNIDLKMIIKFLNDQIIITFCIRDYDLTASYLYQIVNDSLKIKEHWEKDGRDIIYQEEAVSSWKNMPWENFANLINSHSLLWFKLPWNAYYGSFSSANYISDNEKIVYQKQMIIGEHQEGFIQKSFSTKYYTRENTSTTLGMKTILDEESVSILGNLVGNSLYVLETEFSDITTNYHHRSKYYYHSFENPKGINGITPEQLMPLTRTKGFIDNSDLINEDKILKLIRSGNNGNF